MTPLPPKVKLGPNGQPVRPFVMPGSFWGKLSVWRYIIYRRIVQFTTLLLFFGTFHWGWTIFEKPVLSGNLSSSTLLGIIPMADPFATLQMLLTQHWLHSDVLIGASIILLLYTLSGRAWCSWVCPVNLITDLAGWLRKRLNIPDAFPVQRKTRYYVLGLTLALSVITGVAAFEWVSPISVFHRGVIFGIGLGWTALVAIFVFDLLILKHGWCGHLCPLGAFYALTGKAAQLRISFDTPTCTHCCECVRVCPEPQVLNFKKAGETGMISSGECTNCARCITVCPEDTLHLSLRHKITVKKSNERNLL